MDKYGKTDLIREVALDMPGISREQVGRVVDATLATIQKRVAGGTPVVIPGFGTWLTSERAARRGTNLRTKEPIDIPAGTTVRFKAGSTFKALAAGKTMPPAEQALYAKERAVGTTGGSALGEKIRQKVKTRGEKRRA
jgi:DNA-binding protein HU-beta